MRAGTKKLLALILFMSREQKTEKQDTNRNEEKQRCHTMKLFIRI